MDEKYIPQLTMLIAGSITSVLCIVMKRDVLQSLKLLLIVMIMFYVLGLIAHKIIRRVKDSFQKQQEEIEQKNKEKDSKEDGDLEEDVLEENS